jgi:RimJ/RimL family protein N-acetyltransferase
MNSFSPPEQLSGDLITLRRYRLSDGPALKESVEASREHLRPWMPWAARESSDPSDNEYLQKAVSEFGGDHAADYAIILNTSGRYVGGCGLMPRIGPEALEIGYWVDVRYVRRGIATQAAGLLTDAALQTPEIGRVEIHADEANAASNAVPQWLGYRLERTDCRNPLAPGESGRMLIWTVSREKWCENQKNVAKCK